MAAALAGAAGCSQVAVPGPIPPLADQHVGNVPEGRLGLVAGDVELGLHPFYRRWWIDEAVWTDHLVEELTTELSARGVLVDPRAPNALRITLRRFGAGHGMWVHRAYATCTVEDAEGNAVHTRRYSEAGANLPRALTGLMYQVKHGLLTDPNVLRRIRKGGAPRRPRAAERPALDDQDEDR